MKVKLTIPDSLSDITLGQYQRYMEIVEKEKENDSFLNLKSVEIFCNVKINDLRAIKAKDYEDILNDITNAFKTKTPFVNRFELDGVKYGFIPDIENISLGEHIDIETYLADVNTFNKAMAVMYRPIIHEGKGDTYLIEEYETASKYEMQMKKAPLSIYMGSQVFFYNLGRELAIYILESSEEMQTEEGLVLMRILEGSGDGTHLFMHLLEDSYGDSGPSLN